MMVRTVSRAGGLGQGNRGMNAEDIERQGYRLADAGREDLLRSVGTEIWNRWAREILKGKHPRRSDLLAFLRGWVDPVENWLPKGMADYLADRLDPAVPTRDSGGRPPLAYSEESERYERDLDICREVLMSWEDHIESGTPYPQLAACKSVAERFRLSLADVRLAFSRNRKAAEIMVKLAVSEETMESLPNDEIETLAGAGPESLQGLILSALPPDAVKRLAGGESLDRVLRLSDEELRSPSTEQE